MPLTKPFLSGKRQPKILPCITRSIKLVLKQCQSVIWKLTPNLL